MRQPVRKHRGGMVHSTVTMLRLVTCRGFCDFASLLQVAPSLWSCVVP